MNIEELLTVLSMKSIQLRRDGAELLVRGNEGALDSKLVNELHLHKAALFHLIDADSSTWWTPRDVKPRRFPLANLASVDIEQIFATVPGGADNVEDIYPLTSLQEGILFHHLMGQHSDPYLLSSLLSFDNRVRLESFLHATQAVIDRHDILRTSMAWEGIPEPVQVVWRRAQLDAEEVTLDAAEGDIAEQFYSYYNPRRVRLDVRRAPLLHAYFTHDHYNGRWLMIVLYHHLISDLSTLKVMDDEILAFLTGAGHLLPTALPFRKLVEQARSGVTQEAHESFFKDLLGDVEEPTGPFGIFDVQMDWEGITETRTLLGPALTGRLRSAARKLKVSAAALFHLAWARLLACASGRDDVVFGTVLFGRIQDAGGAERVMGPFINTLPVRIKIDDSSVETSVRKTQRRLAELVHHEHASLVLAQRCSAVPPPASLFTALLNYRVKAASNSSGQAKSTAWEGVESLRFEERTSYPFALTIEDTGQDCELRAQVPSSVGPDRICEFMRTTLESLVEALERAPGTPVCALDVLPSSERNEILYKWNQTAVPFPAEACIHELFEQQVERTPKALAVAFRGASLSYEELNLRANRLAHYLRELGARADRPVAICTERNIQMVVALLAVLKAGGAYLPLDPAYPFERLRFMLEDAAPVILLVQGSLQELFATFAFPGAIVNLDAEESWLNRSSSNIPRPINGLAPQNLAYVIYTSGSTGRPKGVMIEHRETCNLIHWARESFSKDVLQQTLFSTSLNFDLSVFECFVPLSIGTTVNVVRNILDTASAANDITLINTAPSAMNALIETGEVPPSVRWVNLCGEPLKISLIERIFAASAAKTICNLYGPSETTTYSTSVLIERTDSFSDTIGRPLANTQIYILDKYGKPAPVGVAGEMYIGGAGVARGYLDRPALTAERFLPDPFSHSPGARMYKTGDLGRWQRDGSLEFLGRSDFQIKIRGFRVELGEIEARLSQHPAVRETAVVAGEDAGGEKRLIAYYTAPGSVGSATNGPAAEELRAHLATSLPEYMVPAVYVQLKSLPLTANGKLDRRALPVPGQSAAATHSSEPPQGPVESALAAIWREVLKLERIGRSDNFFVLGGHSILAMHIILRVRERMGLEISANTFFKHPTILALAGELAQNVRAVPARKQIARRSDDEELILAPQQEIWWYQEQRTGNIHPNNTQFALRLSGHLNMAALEQSFAALQRRHEPLRTTFEPSEKGGATPVVWPPEAVSFPITTIDLSFLAPRQREQFAPCVYRLDNERPFDLTRCPLFRVLVVRLQPDDHLIILTVHHLISDEWSFTVLTKGLSELYTACAEGKPAVFPDLKFQYLDFARWQRDWLTSRDCAEPMAYWVRQLKPPLPEIFPPLASRGKFDEPVLAIRARKEFVIPAAVAEAGRRLARSAGCTLFSALMTALKLVLFAWTGQPDMRVGTVAANRSIPGSEQVVGLFANPVCLRTHMVFSDSVHAVLKSVHQVIRDATDHQELPFDVVSHVLDVGYGINPTSLFPVLFLWHALPAEPIRFPHLELNRRFHTADISGDENLVLVRGSLEALFELTETSTDITGIVTYRQDRFDSRHMDEFISDFSRCLTLAEQWPERTVAALCDLLRKHQCDAVLERA